MNREYLVSYHTKKKSEIKRKQKEKKPSNAKVSKELQELLDKLKLVHKREDAILLTTEYFTNKYKT